MGEFVGTKERASRAISRLRACKTPSELTDVATSLIVSREPSPAVYWEMHRLGVDPNTVAGAGAAPTALISIYARHRRESVREHAKINLLSREIARASGRKIVLMARKHRTDAAVDVAVRFMVASSPATPPETLGYLVTNAGGDFIRDAALAELVRRAKLRKIRKKE